MRKKAAKEEDAAPEPEPGIKFQAEEAKAGEAAVEYKTVEDERPAGQGTAAGVEQAASAVPAAGEAEAAKELPAEEQKETQEAGGTGADEQENSGVNDAVNEPAGPIPVAMPGKEGQFGEGIAGISPTQFTAGSRGNAVNILYKVGGDSPEYRTIKITVPDGWSKPGTVISDEGYFVVATNGGKILSTAAENMSMIIGVYGLPAEKGEVSITYGERRGGGPGVSVQTLPGTGGI